MARCCIFPIFAANSDQEAIQFDPYCPFKDFMYVFYEDLIQISN